MGIDDDSWPADLPTSSLQICMARIDSERDAQRIMDEESALFEMENGDFGVYNRGTTKTARGLSGDLSSSITSTRSPVVSGSLAVVWLT